MLLQMILLLKILKITPPPPPFFNSLQFISIFIFLYIRIFTLHFMPV
ncbi:hypothetical protein PilKf_00012 [Pillotina sp. SPG140]